MENTVAQKLEALSKLQSIDSELDEIEKIRGALPDEVMDLEDEIAGYETRVENHNQVIGDLELSISNNKTSIKDSEKLIEKYKEQQMNVRNNREYDAITKEMELQELEMQIQEKRIKESHSKIESKNLEIEDTKNTLEERKKDLESKKKELEVISSESQDEEEKLMKNRAKAAKQIEERLLNSYNKLRNNVRNKLAVVPVERGACGGCFNVVPPQKQAEIRETKKLIVCEHCGRILSEVIEEIVEEVVKPKRTKRTKAV
tara:strand:- start:34 stop:810 length:777 start_codon:yes stop_codon:yes gene_type:complete